MSLHLFLDFATTRILPKTCPALSWDQALLSFSWVNWFQPSKANRKVSHLVQYLSTWITCACESTVIMLLHHFYVHSRDYRDIRRTLNSTPGLRSHIPCTLVGTSRAFQECEQNREKSRYTVKRVPLTKNRLRGPFVARKKRSSEAILTKGGDFSTLWKTFFILQLQVYDTE